MPPLETAAPWALCRSTCISKLHLWFLPAGQRRHRFAQRPERSAAPAPKTAQVWGCASGQMLSNAASSRSRRNRQHKSREPVMSWQADIISQTNTRTNKHKQTSSQTNKQTNNPTSQQTNKPTYQHTNKKRSEEFLAQKGSFGLCNCSFRFRYENEFRRLDDGMLRW